MTNENYIVALLEEMNGKFDLMMEMMITMNDQLKEKADKSDFDDLKTELHTVRLVVTDTNKQVHRSDRRIERLEAYHT